MECCSGDEIRVQNQKSMTLKMSALRRPGPRASPNRTTSLAFNRKNNNKTPVQGDPPGTAARISLFFHRTARPILSDLGRSPFAFNRQTVLDEIPKQMAISSAVIIQGAAPSDSTLVFWESFPPESFGCSNSRFFFMRSAFDVGTARW